MDKYPKLIRPALPSSGRVDLKSAAALAVAAALLAVGVTTANQRGDGGNLLFEPGTDADAQTTAHGSHGSHGSHTSHHSHSS